MPLIELTTKIQADIEICFDLARNIDLHKISTAKTKEKAIAGKTEGLIELNEWVTWEATHFGIRQQLTSKITAFNRPFHFRDEQVKGAFKVMVHDHFFEESKDGGLMRDVFYFESPFGWIGKAFNQLVLTNYMRRFLEERNAVLKKEMENGKWKMENFEN